MKNRRTFSAAVVRGVRLSLGKPGLLENSDDDDVAFAGVVDLQRSAAFSETRLSAIGKRCRALTSFHARPAHLIAKIRA